MEPGFHKPGNSSDMMALRRTQRLASMEPGFHKPGNVSASDRGEEGAVASMEPGFHKPGNLLLK